MTFQKESVTIAYGSTSMIYFFSLFGSGSKISKGVYLVNNLKRKLSVLLVLLMLLVFSITVLAEEEKTTVTIAGGSVGIELELTKKAAKLFEEKHPNVEVEVFTTPDLSDDRKGLYLQYLEAKSPRIDVFQVDVIWPGELAAHFLDLNDFGAEKVEAKHFETIIKNNTVNDRLVAVPWFIIL